MRRNWNSFKGFLGILLFLMLLNGIKAQEANRFKFGLTVSPSLNWLNIRSEGIDSRGAIPNFNFGLSTDFALKGSDKYYFSTGVKFISNGGKIAYTGVMSDNGIQYSSQIESKIVVRYLEVPIMLKLRTHEIGYSIFAGMFGFGTGFRVNAFEERKSIYYTNSGSLSESTSKEYIEGNINPVRFSLIVGGEWERKITKDTYFTFGVSFNSGLSNIFKTDTYVVDANGNLDWSSVNSDGSPNGPKLKGVSKTFALNLGIYF